MYNNKTIATGLSVILIYLYSILEKKLVILQEFFAFLKTVQLSEKS